METHNTVEESGGAEPLLWLFVMWFSSVSRIGKITVSSLAWGTLEVHVDDRQTENPSLFPSQHVQKKSGTSHQPAQETG